MSIRETNPESQKTVGAEGGQARRAPILVARAVREQPSSTEGGDVGGGLRRTGWPTTAFRLLVKPEAHPWLPRWRTGRAPAARMGLAAAALLLLAAWIFSGCKSAPIASPAVSLPAPAGNGVCDTVRSPKQDLKLTSRDERFTLSFDKVPTTAGAVAQVKIWPRRSQDVAIVKRGEAVLPPDGFDPAGPNLTVTIEPQGGRWPDDALEVQLEVSAPFHTGPALQAYLVAAREDAVAVERRFEQQSKASAGGAGEAEAKSLEELAAAGCKAIPLRAAVEKGIAAIEALDAARAAIYASGKDGLAEAEAARKAWSDARAAVAAAATEAGMTAAWLPLEPGEAAPYRFAAEHLSQLERIGREVKDAEDREQAVRWLSYALAPEGKREERRRALPPLKSIDDAVLRQAWKSIGRGAALPVPLSRELQPRDWVKSCSPLLSRKPGDDEEAHPKSAFALRLTTVPTRAASANACVGQGGGAAVPDQAAAAAALRDWLAMKGGISISTPEQIAAAGMKARCAELLLCGEPTVDAGPLFFLEVGSSLKPLRNRLREIKEATPPDLPSVVKKELDAGATSLTCAIAGDRKLAASIKTMAQYRALVDGARDLFSFTPEALPCDLSAGKLRSRLRQRWMELLSKAGTDEKICASRSGVCPAKIASRVQEVFSLGKGRLASPVEKGSQLEQPPPFGFIRPFIEKVRRCKLCEELSDVRRGIPGDDLSGPECSVEDEEVALQTSLEIGPPGEVKSVELPGCELSTPVRLKLRLKRGAGRVVSVVAASLKQKNGKQVGEKRLHAQLGWAYVRTGDIDDQELFEGREAKLQPTGPDQKFYFLSLRTAAY